DVRLFFFQAEDGIRDATVTGVQTCALPISSLAILCQAQSTNQRAAVRATSAASAQTYTPERISRGSISGSAPVPSITTQQLVSFMRTPTSRGIGGHGAPLLFPGSEYRLHESPGSLDPIGAVEKGCIPTHAVVQERSISAAFASPKSGAITEIHGHERQAHELPRQFDVNADGDAFFGLDIQHQCIGIDPLTAK